MVFITLASLVANVFSASDSSVIASQLGLSTSTVLPFPSATMAPRDAVAFMKSKWTLQGQISFGEKSLLFVKDPISISGSPSTGASGNSDGDVVLAVTYDAGTYSHGTGGADFYSGFGGEKGFDAMLISYDIAFDSDFDWVKGGKLPGLRGGPKRNSCSGGNQPTGTDCFSSRLMWRKDGAGEVYVYIPKQKKLCNVEGIVCNSDYGFSMGRGKFKFTAGQWQNVAVYAKMNSPPSESNGEIALYFNGEQAFSFNNLKFRSSDAVTAGGLYFSTFFGGNDKSWATPKTVHTYYRNFQLFGGSGGGSTGSANLTSASHPSSTKSTSTSMP